MTSLSRRRFVIGSFSTGFVGSLVTINAIKTKPVVNVPVESSQSNFDNTLLARTFKPVMKKIRVTEVPLPELNIEQKITITPKDKMILAKTLYAEARGEGIDGITAVAHVIFNRITTNYHVFKNLNSISEACLGKSQFSCWLSKIKMRKIDTNKDDFKEIYNLIDSIHQDYEEGNDISRGSLYYIRKDMKRYPKWTKKMNKVAVINHHVFFEPKDYVGV